MYEENLRVLKFLTTVVLPRSTCVKVDHVEQHYYFDCLLFDPIVFPSNQKQFHGANFGTESKMVL
jgi:hypothetical protein